ncbi:protein of unknown function [Taphrina deformans PYCC 5710]|uniref:Uncharacterized protein n=1 Tax=Taphrina deformans (strain PYCC 5710 / ATCC 11124 / CBS 356.35 / IMI 108563 / JCM 9778 / NBRC 8474) TaxID=1097556 RepID=R4X7P1_TAPDE|nr:protein of unknown function [Taphrina deformans PYCC 5710]|eukprot:CCG81435.1 protein of unknown function [Taphrina deformans PYCC 5710]
MNHFKPHTGCAFEGYYAKFRLPSGAHLALIISTVHHARERPYMVSITYVPKDSRSHWQREYWPDLIEYIVTGRDSFEMRVPGIGCVKCSGEDESFDLVTDEFTFHAQTVPDTRQPWLEHDRTSTPAGLLVHAPLPIQWHVHTLSTDLTFSLALVSQAAQEPALHGSDSLGSCTVHHEKNWARSFPAKYIWVQAWDPDRGRGLCIAGGEALPGVEAYLMTYTLRRDRPAGPSSSQQPTITLTPPWTFGVLGYSPFCRTRHEYRHGRLSIDVRTWFTRLEVCSVAPKETFFRLSAPLPEGHRPNFACESFAATHTVTVHRRTWPWQPWQVTSTDRFEHGSLEFGGGYYDDAKQD